MIPALRMMWFPKRQIYQYRACRALCAIIVVAVVIAALLLTSTTARNALLSQFLPHTWSRISASRLLYMHSHTPTYNIGTCPSASACPRIYVPPRSRKEASYPGVKFYEDKRFETIAYHSHKGNFLPLLTRQEKIDALYTLEVMAFALREAGLQFFLVDGTLLGLVRHHAMIPWDDDIDVALNGSQWQDIRRVLCCVRGFTLRMKPNMHWRFYMDNAMIVGRTPDIRFPFVDMFLYTEDATWVWSMTDYNIQNLAFPKTDLFPLASTMFEGRQYPIPRFPNKVIRQQFGGLKTCVSAGMFHKYNHPLQGEEKSVVPCSLLSDMYDFYNGLDGFS